MPARQLTNHGLFFSAFVIIVFALLLPRASHVQSSPHHPIFIDDAGYFSDYSHPRFLLNDILTRPSRNQTDLSLP
jgi:hypothetical protein